MLTFRELILDNWQIMLSFFFLSNFYAIMYALSEKFGELSWRVVKLLSTGAGALSVIVFISNVELAIRAETSEKSEQDRLLEFIEAKSLILEQIGTSCNNIPNELCGFAGTANGTIRSIRLQNELEFRMPGPMPLDAEGRSFYDELKRHVEVINASTRFSNDIGEVLSGSNRLAILFFGQVLIIFAVAGSVGEATFQLRKSVQKRRSLS